MELGLIWVLGVNDVIFCFMFFAGIHGSVVILIV